MIIQSHRKNNYVWQELSIQGKLRKYKLITYMTLKSLYYDLRNETEKEYFATTDRVTSFEVAKIICSPKSHEIPM